jgi:predicted transcriptional regulator
MHTPQEIDVWYILPTIRREIALALVKKGLKQREVAERLGMTEAAVSQYIKNKRAKSIELPPEIKKDIRKAAENLAREQDCHRYEIQALLNQIRTSGFLCKVHRKYDNVPSCCNVCLHGFEVR